MNRRQVAVKAAALFALVLSTAVGGLPGRADENASGLYDAAIRTMANLPEPAYVAYRLEGQAASGEQGVQLDLEGTSPQVVLFFVRGTKHSTLYVLHRERDFENAIVDERRQDYYTNRSFFDPTWSGAYSALHDGMFGAFAWAQPAPASPAPTGGAVPSGPTPSAIASVRVAAPGPYGVGSVLTPAPASEPKPVASRGIAATRPPQAGNLDATASDSDLKTIALVHVMGPAIYQVRDGGSTTCENGDPGRALHLYARKSPKQHQLTDAIVDLPLLRFCMLRFSFSPNNMNLAVEQHYASVDGYWVQTDGVVSTDVPALPPPGLTPSYSPGDSLPFGKITLDWRYSLLGMSFPKNIPDAIFSASGH